MSLPTNPFAIPFPTGWFHPRCRAPLSHRWGGVVEYWLSRHVQPKLAPKQNGTLQYITMAGRSHWLLLRESLVSLHRTWNLLPPLTIVSDGSWARDEFLEAFWFWPEPMRVLMPADITEPLQEAGHTALVQLAKQHPLGLKLAAIVFLARQQRALFVDSDILWFSDPRDIMIQFDGCQGPVASVENKGAFNESLVRQHCPEGLMPPPVNTGCVYLKGELCDPDLLQALLNSALQQPKHNFNEQSIIAVAVQKNGKKFPPEFCLVDFADAFAFKRQKPWRNGFRARHYVNWMRHQFYRDALKLRNLAAAV